MIRSILYAILLGFVLTGCLGVSGKYFTHRGPAQIDTTELRLGGYYYREVERPDDRHIQPILLWQDGTAAYFDHYYDHPFDAQDSTLAGDTFEEGYVAFVKDLEEIERGKSSRANWGAFRLKGDSISIQVMQTVIPGLNKWTTLQMTGFVRNDSTFILTETYAPRDDRRYSTMEIYHFRPLENKPTSENWTQTHRKLR